MVMHSVRSMRKLSKPRWRSSPNRRLKLILVVKLARPLTLMMAATDTANPADGDVVFAYLDKPRSPVLAERVLVVTDLDGTFDNAPFLPLVPA